jgi:riboflavin synthase
MNILQTQLAVLLEQMVPAINSRGCASFQHEESRIMHPTFKTRTTLATTILPPRFLYTGNMFTGIIEQTGTLVGIEVRGGVHRITVEAPELAVRMREGDSLGVSGVCLTALDVNPKFFFADLAQETLDCTSLGSLKPGCKVNLELPTAAGSPLGGHIVQGHVDGTGTLVSLEPVIPQSSPQYDRETTDWTLKIRVPENVRPWMVHKGSVAIEGISLTIADFDGEVISIAILPLTYWRTNLHTLAAGAPINVEADVLVKMAHAQMLAQKQQQSSLTAEWLVASGF